MCTEVRHPRFPLFSPKGDLRSLVRWWQNDRASSKRRLQYHRPREQDPVRHQDALRSLRLLSEGEMSRAIKLLTSLGLGDLTDERVIRQLAEKRPARKSEMPANLDEFARGLGLV